MGHEANLEVDFSRNTVNMRRCGIRDMLSPHPYRGKMISLAAGAPDSESYPLKELSRFSELAIAEYGSDVLDYGSPEGFEPLREVLPRFLTSGFCEEISRPSDVIVTAGATEALHLLSQVFLDRGSEIIVDTPTYVGAIEVFDIFRPNYIAVNSDQYGVDPDSLRQVFLQHPNIKFFYTQSDFPNPTGKTVPDVRRREIAIIARELGLLIIEDNPYWRLRYKGKNTPPIQHYAPDFTIGVHSLSKILGPGIRMGAMTVPRQEGTPKNKRIINKVIEMKARETLATSALNQAIASKLINDNFFDGPNGHVQKLIDIYRPRGNAMKGIIDESFPDSFQFTSPEGGFFIWGELKDKNSINPHFNMGQVIRELRENYGIDFIDGKYFYANSRSAIPSMRFNFARWPIDVMVPAMRTIGEVLTHRLKK